MSSFLKRATLGSVFKNIHELFTISFLMLKKRGVTVVRLIWRETQIAIIWCCCLSISFHWVDAAGNLTEGRLVLFLSSHTQPVCLRPLQCLIYEAVFSPHVRQHWLWESREALRSWRAVSRVWTASVGSSPRPPPGFFSFTVSLCAYTDLYLHTSTCFFPWAKPSWLL